MLAFLNELNPLRGARKPVKAVVPALLALSLAACATTPPEPVIQPVIPEPEPVIEEPVIEEPEPEPVDTGLIPPHMQDQEIVRVALLLPFSAESSGLRGESLRLLRAAELALFERAGSNLVMIPKDTGGTPEGAQSAATAAIADGADLIIGPLLGSSVNAAGAISRANDVPMIAFSTDLSTAGDGVYLLSFPPQLEVARVVEYTSRQGVDRFAYLGPQNAYGMAVYNALQNEAEMNTGYVAAESFYTGDVEAMSRAASRLAEGVFEPLTPEEADALRQEEWIPSEDAPFQAVILPEGGVRLRALAPLLISQPVDPLVVRFLGTGLWMDERLQREPALAGGWFAGPDQSSRTRFETSYEVAYGSEPSRIASLAYDAMALAAHLDGGEDGYSAAALENPEGFFGADGLFRFGPDGVIERGLAVYQMHPRGFREIEPAPQSFEPEAF